MKRTIYNDYDACMPYLTQHKWCDSGLDLIMKLPFYRLLLN